MGDQELLELMRRDPEAGVRELVQQYGGLVYSIVNGRAGGVTAPQDVEECASDVIFEVFQKSGRVDLKKGSLKAFVAVVARQRAVNLYHKMAKERGRAAPEGELDATPDAERPEDVFLREDSRSRLLEAVHSLGEPDSSIIIRKYYFGQKAKEIAADLGLSTGAVDTRLSRALEKLRKKMGGSESWKEL